MNKLIYLSCFLIFYFSVPCFAQDAPKPVNIKGLKYYSRGEPKLEKKITLFSQRCVKLIAIVGESGCSSPHVKLATELKNNKIYVHVYVSYAGNCEAYWEAEGSIKVCGLIQGEYIIVYPEGVSLDAE